MAIVTTDNQHYADIASAIRAKNSSAVSYTPARMAAAIAALVTGDSPYALKTGTCQSSDGSVTVSTGLSYPLVFLLYTGTQEELAEGKISHVFSIRGTADFPAVNCNSAITVDSEGSQVPAACSMISWPSPGGWKYRNFPSGQVTPLPTDIQYHWIAVGTP